MSYSRLIPHFYDEEIGKAIKTVEKGVNALSGLYLISTELVKLNAILAGELSVNALSGLYLISTEYKQMLINSKEASVSMPSRAYTSFLPHGDY